MIRSTSVSVVPNSVYIIPIVAPVSDLRCALLEGKIGSLNPVPWAVMSGNCVVSIASAQNDLFLRNSLSDAFFFSRQGWCAYAYYANDPFILAANLPGLVLSFWLNMGAAKLQYYQLRHTDSDESIDVEESGNDVTTERVPRTAGENYVFVSQEVLFLRILVFWFIVLVCVGWLVDGREKFTIGVIVNINLIFFYGAPLQAMNQVINEKSSDSIHVRTMVMNWFNTSFWLMYGVVKLDPVIYLPNTIGLFLGITQGALCLLYPRREEPDIDMQPLLQQEEEEDDIPGGNNDEGRNIS